MIRACLSLLAGMYAAQLSSFAELSGYLSTIFCIALLLASARCSQMLIFYCVGALIFLIISDNMRAHRMPAEFAGDSIVLDIELVDFPERRGASSSFLVRPVSDRRFGQRIRLSWFEPPVELRLGDTWRLEVRLRRPRGLLNPGAFDFEAWLFRERITALGYVVDGPRNHLLRSDSVAPIARLRRHFVDRVQDLLHDTEQTAVLAALVVGTRHLLSDTQWQRYALTGTSHLMAISGLHIGLAAGGAYFASLCMAALITMRGEQRNHRQVAVVCALGVALFYACISGFAVPARRASLMLALAAPALIMRRRPDLPGVVCVAAAFIAMTDPLATMAPGFLLSFAAVALLLWNAAARGNLLAAQAALWFGLLPLTSMLFARVSFAAFAVNLVAVPLFSFVTVPLALLGFVCDGAMQFCGDAFLRLAAMSIAVLDAVLASAAALRWAAISLPTLHGMAALLVVLSCLWAVLPVGFPGRKLACIGVAGLLQLQPALPGPGCARVDILDVGQGLAVTVQAGTKVLLYDTGPAYRSAGSAASSVVLPHLQYRGIRALDRLVVSHADLDHAGGVSDVLAALPVRYVLAGEPLPGVHATACRAGQHWSYNGILFRVLHPGNTVNLQGNNSSCVLLVQAGAYRVLLSGDIEQEAERDLLLGGRLPAVDAILVPHHGSRTSSTLAFANHLQPSIAIVSSGHGNHWGLPKSDVVTRWQDLGAEVMNTAITGAIELRLCADSGLRVIRRYRLDKRRIWHE